MYKIKQTPEDFVVEEVTKLKTTSKGKYAYALLTKKDYTTEKAVTTIAKALRIQRKDINYAGTKDKRAVTKQFMSIKHTSKEKIMSLKLKDINLEFIGYGDERLGLGSLEGNKFKITIRNMVNEKLSLVKQVPNYYDEQRFSQSNKEIGELILKKNFKEAVKKILGVDKENSQKISEHLSNHKNDFVGALLLLARNTVKMYIHSYQSYLFNETIKRFITEKHEDYKTVKYSQGEFAFPKKNLANRGINVLGFGTKLEQNEADQIITSLMEKEGITQRNFVIPQLQNMSAEGTTRSLVSTVKNLKIGELTKDELNKGKKKLTIEFELSKGSYATIVVKALFA